MVQNGSVMLPMQLRKLRNDRNLSQRELARLTGLTDVTISRIEQSPNAARVSIETLERLAEALHVTTDTLLGRLPSSTQPWSSAPFLVHLYTESSAVVPLSEPNAVRAYASYYGELLADTGQIVFAANMNHELLYVNSTYERVFRYQHSELIGKCTYDLIDASSLQLCEEMRAQKLNGIPLTTYRVTALTKTRRPVPLEITTQLIYHDSKPIGIQGIGQVVDPSVLTA